MNLGGVLCVVDGQNGLVATFDDPKGRTYFNTINYSNSYMARLDHLMVDRGMLVYNNSKYLTPWDHDVDIAYMKEHGMLTESIAQPESILLEMAYEDAADLMRRRLRHYCKEFNGSPQFEQIEKVWKKNWPDEKPPKLSPYMEVSSEEVGERQRDQRLCVYCKYV